MSGDISTAKESEYFTIQEAALEIGVTETAIRNATLEGRLPFERKYGRKLITPSELLAYKERTQVDGEPRRGRPRKVNKTSIPPSVTEEHSATVKE